MLIRTTSSPTRDAIGSLFWTTRLSTPRLICHLDRCKGSCRPPPHRRARPRGSDIRTRRLVDRAPTSGDRSEALSDRKEPQAGGLAVAQRIPIVRRLVMIEKCVADAQSDRSTQCLPGRLVVNGPRGYFVGFPRA